jgi:hypothetical protein
MGCKQPQLYQKTGSRVKIDKIEKIGKMVFTSPILLFDNMLSNLPA